MPPLTSVAKDPGKLTLTVVGDYPVSQQRLWDAFADPRQLERFWGPPDAPATFTRHEFRAGGRAEYFLTGSNGEKWTGSWLFTAVDPIGSFAAVDGDGNPEGDSGPSAMTVTFETTATGSRVTIVSRFASLEAMEANLPGMEVGMRAAVPQLDVVLSTNTRSSL